MHPATTPLTELQRFGEGWQTLNFDPLCGTWITAGDNRFTYASEIGATVLGRPSPGEVTGQSVRDLFPTADAAAYEEELDGVRSNRSPRRLQLLSGGVAFDLALFPSQEITSTGPGPDVLSVARADPFLRGGAPPIIQRMEEGREEATPARRITLDPGPLGKLTERELQVLALIGDGLSTAEIAQHLNRSVKTIEGHRLNLGTKLGASNRVQLARIALGAGLKHADDA
ncbi:MAG: LuxR C-terminal-related transcriptional regulator [Planctomycetota bacterium]